MCYKEFIADHVTFSQSGGRFIAMDCKCLELNMVDGGKLKLLQILLTRYACSCHASAFQHNLMPSGKRLIVVESFKRLSIRESRCCVNRSKRQLNAVLLLV